MDSQSQLTCGSSRGSTLRARKMTYPRKRAVTAFDPASLLILDKLNQVLDRLNPQAALARSASSIQSDRSDHPVPSPQAAAGNPVFQADATPLALDGLQIPSSFSSPDWVLDWPIFDDQFRQGCLAEELFVAEHLSSQTSSGASSGSRSRGGICDDDVPRLVARFLHFVHIKNPILDPKAVTQLANRVAEDGAGWDASSCLVLLACALGAISAAFDARTRDCQHLDPAIRSDRVTADSYYQLACRRLGLLDQSLIAAQCHLLSGIYLMYTIHPLQAQLRFFQVSSIYATYLKGQVALQQRRGREDDPMQCGNSRLEQCLYWTCFKSECEISQELDLPVSGLAALAYPYMFPSPPTPDNELSDSPDNVDGSVPTPASASSLLSLVHGRLRQVEEQSWYYYLSEIALRRIANRVSHCFYREDHTSWSRLNIYEAAIVVTDLETQLENWMATVPSSFRGLSTSHTNDELGAMILARYLGMKCYIYRPFLYYAIHHPVIDPAVREIIEPLAEKAIHSISEFVSGGKFYHRHHGTWLCCREVTSCALVLLAAHQSGLVPGPPVESQYNRPGCADLVEICIDVLKYWESESADIAKSREMVDLLRNQIIGDS
ncbi:hypothetical protein BJX64DRAFT_301264 [Aspergillus heterothallicus]